MKILHILYWSWYYQFYQLDQVIAAIAQGRKLEPMLTQCSFYDIVNCGCYWFMLTGIAWDMLFLYALFWLHKRNK